MKTYYGKQDGKPLVKHQVMESGREYWHIKKRDVWIYSLTKPDLSKLREIKNGKTSSTVLL